MTITTIIIIIIITIVIIIVIINIIVVILIITLDLLALPLIDHLADRLVLLHLVLFQPDQDQHHHHAMISCYHVKIFITSSDYDLYCGFLESGLGPGLAGSLIVSAADLFPHLAE